jgi:hypothetical protein
MPELYKRQLERLDKIILKRKQEEQEKNKKRYEEQEERNKRHKHRLEVSKAMKAFREDLYEIYKDKTKENDIEYLLELDEIIKKKMKKINKISSMWIND